MGGAPVFNFKSGSKEKDAAAAELPATPDQPSCREMDGAGTSAGSNRVERDMGVKPVALGLRVQSQQQNCISDGTDQTAGNRVTFCGLLVTFNNQSVFIQ
jgi:hypothetical protein